MRADRLLSLLLLLQHRGRRSAQELADELEVSTRTVLRDIEALSAAGVPVYAERGRHGGFALLPGYSTDLTGLSHDEALALLVAGSRGDGAGMAPALASAMRKVVAGLPAAQRESAGRDAGRILVQDGRWLPRAPATGGGFGEVRDGGRGQVVAGDGGAHPEPLAGRRAGAGRRRRGTSGAGADEVLTVVRAAVFAGRRLDLRYAARDEEPRWRTVDPVGLVSQAGRWYLLALRDGEERTYRLSRVREVRERAEQAVRPPDVDLDEAWRARRTAFLASLPTLPVEVRVRARRRADLLRTAGDVLAEEPAADGWLRLTVAFGDAVHAERVLWSMAADVEVLAPAELRAATVARVAALAERYTPE